MTVPLLREKPMPFVPPAKPSAETAVKSDEDSWDNEGGHMSSSRGRIVYTPGTDLPYTAILSHHGGEDSERRFATMREAEAYVGRNTPVPTARRTLYDRDAPSS
jgi:hypothetical protein